MPRFCPTREQALNIIAFLLATAGIICMPQLWNPQHALGFTNSILAVFFWLLCLYVIRLALGAIDLADRRGWLIAGVFSLLFTAAMLFGARLDFAGSVDFADWKLWVSLPVLTCFFAVFTRMLWSALCRRDSRPARGAKRKTVRHENLFIFLFLLLCWLPQPRC